MRTTDDLTLEEGQRLLATLDFFNSLKATYLALMQEAVLSLDSDPDALARFRGLDDQMVAAERDMNAVFAALGLTPPWATERSAR